jgi:hypothetical protein
MLDLLLFLQRLGRVSPICKKSALVCLHLLFTILPHPPPVQLCYSARMNRLCKILALALLAGSASCGRSLDRQIRETVATFDRMNLPADAVEIEKVSEIGDSVIAEVKVKSAVKMRRVGGEWVIEEIRLGDRQWERADHILRVVNEERGGVTWEQMRIVATAVDRYHNIQGELPPVDDFVSLIDVLSPEYLTSIIRIDAWSQPFQYRRLS